MEHMPSTVKDMNQQHNLLMSLNFVRTESKLAKMEMINSGTVLKKQTKTSHRNPIIFLRASSPWVLFMLVQIYNFE